MEPRKVLRFFFIDLHTTTKVLSARKFVPRTIKQFVRHSREPNFRHLSLSRDYKLAG